MAITTYGKQIRSPREVQRSSLLLQRATTQAQNREEARKSASKKLLPQMEAVQRHPVKQGSIFKLPIGTPLNRTKVNGLGIT